MTRLLSDALASEIARLADARRRVNDARSYRHVVMSSQLATSEELFRAHGLLVEAEAALHVAVDRVVLTAGATQEAEEEADRAD